MLHPNTPHADVRAVLDNTPSSPLSYVHHLVHSCSGLAAALIPMNNAHKTTISPPQSQIYILQRAQFIHILVVLPMLTLRALCLKVLLRYKQYLGDLGDVPVGLLWHVLKQCSAEQLAAIEDATACGGRSLRNDTWYLWQCLYHNTYRHQRIGAADVPILACPPQHALPDGNTLPPDAVQGDWRWLYFARQQEEECKMAAAQAAARVTLQQERDKHRKAVQLDRPLPQNHLRRRNSTGSSSSGASRYSGGGGAGGTSVRSRILKKLGAMKK